MTPFCEVLIPYNFAFSFSMYLIWSFLACFLFPLIFQNKHLQESCCQAIHGACGIVYSQGNPPSIANNCIIPTGLAFWPTNFNNASTGACSSLRIMSSAYVEVPNAITLTTAEEIRIGNGGQLKIKTGGTFISN